MSRHSLGLLHLTVGRPAACQSSLQVLLQNGADVNAVTKLRGSPLHAAAMHSTGVSVRVLLDRWVWPHPAPPPSPAMITCQISCICGLQLRRASAAAAVLATAHHLATASACGVLAAPGSPQLLRAPAQEQTCSPAALPLTLCLLLTTVAKIPYAYPAPVPGPSLALPACSGADPLLKNAEGRSAIDVAVANGFANLAQLMRDAANRQAVKRREASAAHYSDGSAASLPRTSAQGTPQYRGQPGMQPRVSGAFGYPEWNATSSMAQPQPGQQRFRGLPSEMMTLATQQAAAAAAQPQQPQARVSPQQPPQPRVSPPPAADAAPAADGVPRPSPFDQAAGQAAGQRATPPATPPRGSPGGVTPNTSSNNLAKQPTTAEAYLAQFKEAAAQGQAGSGEQRQLSAGASSAPSSNRQGSGALQGGSGEAAAAVPPHLIRNAGGVPAWWLGPQPSLGPGQSPRHARTISPPTIQEGVPLAGAAAVGNGAHAGEHQQQHDFNTGSSSTSGGSRWGPPCRRTLTLG